ncbi:PAQR family membrane homeostasis protein TrhA [Lichenihabitans psoromatis]|uniref:PAQR family membrane homeostasis protein TrhA n=1 Tax=Lichenihabitans psoromatis TaxID=2528642 RepID=UPI0010366EBF|nr:hemolysin III family protein [Lichenihabitans psoromatis]
MIETLDPPGSRAWPYGWDEILADGIIHGLGLVLAVVGTVVMMVYFSPRDHAGLLPHAIYCGTLLITLTASAVYNMWPVSPAKWVLRRVDHAMIFALIAGTYTPFLIRIGSLQSNLLLLVIWTVSLIGMALKLANLGRREWLSTLLYIGIGWSGLLAIPALVGTLPSISLFLIFGGGLLYSFGVIFHHWRALRFQNAIWHGFVLAAATCHFGAVVTAINGT